MTAASSGASLRVNHVNIVVADMERSLAFYVGLLGLRATFEIELEGAWIEQVTGLAGVSARCVFCQPADGGVRFELLEYRRPEGERARAANSVPSTGGLRHVAFEVDDVAAEYERLMAAGVRFVSPPVTVPFGVAGDIRKRLCYALDPDGVLVEFADYRPATE